MEQSGPRRHYRKMNVFVGNYFMRFFKKQNKKIILNEGKLFTGYY